MRTIDGVTAALIGFAAWLGWFVAPFGGAPGVPVGRVVPVVEAVDLPGADGSEVEAPGLRDLRECQHQLAQERARAAARARDAERRLEVAEGRTTDWTPALDAAVGERRLTEALRGCPTFTGARFACDEYPCLVGRDRVSDDEPEDVEPCLPPGAHVVFAAEKEVDGRTVSAVAVERVDGPEPDLRRLETRFFEDFE